MSKISVLLVEDHVVVRQGLRSLLKGASDLEVVGEADTGREGVQMARDLHPDVILMDIAMPMLNGIEATRIIKREWPEAKVLMLSTYSEDSYVQRVMEAGATGYLVKHSAADDLLTAIREVHRGNAFFSPSVATRILDHCRAALTGTHMTRKNFALTSREVEVLQLIAEGYPNKQIADILEISVKTVEKHRQQLMDKLNIHDTASLTRYAIAKGIVESHLGGGLMLN
ncbi:response regulator [Verrucomicrobiota bacterium sgz303538]